MLFYLLRRAAMTVPLLLGITVISFGVMHLAPGEPVDMTVDLRTRSAAAAQARLRELYGLDQPLYVQYGRWLARLARLDFGRSFSPDRRPVMEKIVERLPVTVAVNAASLLLILAVGIPAGAAAAARRGAAFDRTSTVLVFFFFAVPGFWLAQVCQIVFGIHLQWLPTSGLRSAVGFEDLGFWARAVDYLRHLTLPVLVGALGGLAGISRYMRAGMIDALSQDYVRTARAKGLPEGAVVYRHALRNALLPIITILGLSIPGLIAGSVIFETIFAIPGLGQLMWQAVMARDYPVVMGSLVLAAVLTLAGNLLADIGYCAADPRITLHGDAGR